MIENHQKWRKSDKTKKKIYDLPGLHKRWFRHAEHENNPPELVIADKEKIEQVVTNLVDNSIKYGKENGTTEIVVQKLTDEKIREKYDAMTDEEKIELLKTIQEKSIEQT